MERVCGKNGGTNPKMAERRGGTLGAERGKKEKKNEDGGTESVREGKQEGKKKEK